MNTKILQRRGNDVEPTQELALPTVSILIPTYNRENFIGECIESALNQTFTAIEIILVDNASTDRTWQICQYYASRDSRIRIFRNDSNIGPVRNWIRCLEKARGKYAKILFSDDLMFPDFISRTLPLLQDPSVAFAFSAAYIGGTIESGAVCYSNGPRTYYSIDEYLPLLIRGSVPYSPGAALFRTADVRKNLLVTLPTCSQHDFWRHGAGPDVLLYALTTRDYRAVAAVEEPLVLFRAHAGSITICNNNNEVAAGYRAALAWFFAKCDTHSLWYDYLATQWLTDPRITRSWESLGDFIEKNEGKGTVREQYQLMATATFLICPLPWLKVLNYQSRHA